MLACSTARATQNLAAPVQLAPNVVRPKSSTVSATFSPLPSWPRTFSRGHEHVVERQPAGRGAADAHFAIRFSTTSKPGMSGVTRKAVILVSLPSGAGVRAITVSTWAMPPLVIQRFWPLSTKPLPSARRRGGRLHVGGVAAGLRLGQGEGADPLAAGQLGQPAPLAAPRCRTARAPAGRSSGGR